MRSIGLHGERTGLLVGDNPHANQLLLDHERESILNSSLDSPYADDFVEVRPMDEGDRRDL